MNAGKRLLGLLAKYKGRLILAGLCGVVAALCNIFIAQLLNWFTQAAQGADISSLWIMREAVAHGLTQGSDPRMVLVVMVAVLAVLVHVPKSVFMYLDSYLVASVTNRVGADMREMVFINIQHLPLRYFHSSRMGDIMSRLTNDVTIVSQSSQVLTQAIDGPVLIIGGLARMLMLSWKLTLLTIVFVPLMGYAIDLISRKIRSLTRISQEKIADVNAVVSENVRAARIVRAFSTEYYEVDRFTRVNNGSLHAALAAARRYCAVLPSIELMGSVAVALIVLIGGWMVVTGEFTFAVFMEYNFLAFMVAGAAKQFGRLNVMYQQVTAASARIFELADVRGDMHEEPMAENPASIEGSIEVEDVSFEYTPGEKVLDHVSFDVPAGKVVALVGPSGAGKSTLADLVPRFYDVTGGSVKVDGIDVRKFKISGLRKHIAIVPQETILFSTTIAENIAYGVKRPDMHKIWEAAKAANAHDFISGLPEGYSTRLGEGGSGLSGGQKQRIAIARAILADPKILILDEATSSLDAASEAAVNEALERLMHGRTTIVIAHRLSTVKNADKIAVLDKGRVIETGDFESLSRKDGLFSELYSSQIEQTGGYGKETGAGEVV